MEGRRCDACKNGFWNFSERNVEGCERKYLPISICYTRIKDDKTEYLCEIKFLSLRHQMLTACSCNILGTYGNQGCNKETGECTCKRNVIGRDCNKCLPEYWGLGDTPEGCQPCNCNRGGAYDNQCDIVTGQCK